jgi:predicted metal-dependent phosphoesterase TrpH
MLNKTIDLHTHTTYSDGSLTPSELVLAAKEKGLSALAVTDHDTIQGIPEAILAAEQIGMDLIPGVEISVDFNPEMHILGFFSKLTYKNISESINQLKLNREERNPKIAAKLNELGMEISMKEVAAEAGGSIIARPHFAAVLVKKGYVSSIKDAFNRYLASGRPAYFKKDKLTPAEGIQSILKAGGVPVLAHPVHLGFGNTQLNRLLGELSAAGLMGIEAYYVDNSKADTGFLLRMAIKYNLLATGGSDYHGKFKPDIELGVGYGSLAIPYECFTKLNAVL